jgi:DNA-binding transcriptional ArsR family regulator
MESEPVDDAVWRALAHPMRRRLLDLLRDGPRPTGDLVDAIGAPRHSVLQHLTVLREADLVLVEARGRRRINFLNPVPIRLIYERWGATYAQHWTAALVGLKQTVERAHPASNPSSADEEADLA